VGSGCKGVEVGYAVGHHWTRLITHLKDLLAGWMVLRRLFVLFQVYGVTCSLSLVVRMLASATDSPSMSMSRNAS
jgi:hypothetical protein